MQFNIHPFHEEGNRENTNTWKYPFSVDFVILSVNYLILHGSYVPGKKQLLPFSHDKLQPKNKDENKLDESSAIKQLKQNIYG